MKLHKLMARATNEGNRDGREDAREIPPQMRPTIAPPAPHAEERAAAIIATALCLRWQGRPLHLDVMRRAPRLVRRVVAAYSAAYAKAWEPPPHGDGGMIVVFLPLGKP